MCAQVSIVAHRHPQHPRDHRADEADVDGVEQMHAGCEDVVSSHGPSYDETSSHVPKMGNGSHSAHITYLDRCWVFIL